MSATPERNVEVAFDDRGRGIIESYAHTALLLALRHRAYPILDARGEDGLRTTVLACGDFTVTFTFPIWFAPDGTAVSWQVDFDEQGQAVTAMTGVGVDAGQDALLALLDALADPQIRQRVAKAGPLGTEVLSVAISALWGLPR